MDKLTAENLAIALAAGVVTFVVTFATFHWIRPSIKKAINS